MRKHSLARATFVLALALFCPLLTAVARLRLAETCGGNLKRPIALSDIPTELRQWLERWGVGRGAEGFAAYITSINARTAERELRGEYDHLVFFLLQSSLFTKLPKIEPALSAREYVESLSEDERLRYLAEGSSYLPESIKLPRAVAARLGDFVRAIEGESKDQRLLYFRDFTKRASGTSEPPGDRIVREYARAMRFLYQKEFTSRSVKGEDVAAYVESLYQRRGYSTDTQVDANFAVYTALAALRARTGARPIRLDKVLIVGPGLDFAPRTDLVDLFGPQCYQPFAVADALLQLGLADRDRLRIHCVDINERVIGYLRNLRQGDRVTLALLSGAGDSRERPLTDEYKSYFRDLGRAVGLEDGLRVPDQFSSRLKKSLRVTPEAVKAVSVDCLNIISERYDPSPGYDLVVVTNVFPYFEKTELLLAMANISSMMSEGGYLIHNELQTVPREFLLPLGLPLEEARTVLIAASESAPLFDGVAVHRKTRA
jgi:hypothetical protein